MKRITFSADEEQIRLARLVARAQNRTLGDAFREWLSEFTSGARNAQGFDALMKKLHHVDSGQRFSRSEMNDR
jgi:hypothetical protein